MITVITKLKENYHSCGLLTSIYHFSDPLVDSNFFRNTIISSQKHNPSKESCFHKKLGIANLMHKNGSLLTILLTV